MIQPVRRTLPWIILAGIIFFAAVAAGSPTPVHLTWQDNSPAPGFPVSEDGFRLQRAVGGPSGVWFTIVTTLPDVEEYLDEVTLPGTVYAYRCFAFKGSLVSASSNVATVTTPSAGSDEPPNGPATLSAVLKFPPRLINLSARAPVLVGAEIVIGGFVIADAPGVVLIRAVGPGLSQFGVPGVLADPFLRLIGGPSNDDWQDTDSAAISAAAARVDVNAFALAPGSRDAALLVTLPPGAYTVHVTGQGGSTGIMLLETYLIPSP